MRLSTSRIFFLFCALAVSACAQVGGDVKSIAVSGAPKAAGPYSQGIVANGFLFRAGFTPRDPVTNLAGQGDITIQTNRVFDNIEAVLVGAGATWKDVVKVNVYMTNLSDFGKMNEVMSARLGDDKPARTTVGAGSLPSGVPIEIDVIARRPR